ncbi:exlusion protein FxsA [Natrinema saccharevitans]|uniref:Exlusion protein FxsA n=1 Tax=Natrinema saccharevitans TaxID=301967 RepID=A0A1S8AZ10_9EURY|nr:FxsA family protein [Natrinema saccharevitans]OLZ42098.1 exlusion protein FxsA [Natrinema saccharevitans]
MLRWIFALLLIPFLDAVLLAVIVTQFDALSWVGMILLVVLTGLVGMLLVRAEGRRTIRKMQRSMAQGQPPTNELLDGGLLIAAGAFLLTPGLVTDLLGFLLAVPLTRVPIRMALKRYVVVPYADKKTGGFASGGVWTFGFPDEDPTRDTADSNDGGTYDLGEDAYSVDDEDAYTIDFEDERSDDGDDDRDDDPLAR